MSACVLDTDVVIAALDRRDAHHAEAARVLEAMVGQDVERLLCTINYAEALVRPAQEEKTLRMAVDAIGGLGVRLVAPSAAVARDAARCRAAGISLADGFALATARLAGATVASFDRRVLRALPGAGLEPFAE